MNVVEMIGKVVSKKTSKRRPNKENDVTYIAFEDSDKLNGETDRPTDDINDEILSNNHDELMADGNANTDLTGDNMVKWKREL